MKNVKYLFVIMILACTAVLASAQGAPKPVRWSLNVKMTSATEGEVIIKAVPSDGWHLYGLTLPKGGPKATEVDLTGSTGVKFAGALTYAPKPTSVHDQMFDLDLTWWGSTVVFRRKFTVENPGGQIKCTVKYMACNDQSCTPPATETLVRNIPVKK